MKVITREQARAKGIKKYFTGKPCKNDHYSERWVSNKVCIECLSEWREANPEKNKESSRKSHSVWVKNNREHLRKYHKQWRDKNPEKILAYVLKKKRKGK